MDGMDLSLAFRQKIQLMPNRMVFTRSTYKWTHAAARGGHKGHGAVTYSLLNPSASFGCLYIDGW
jgi:hypothetical protein